MVEVKESVRQFILAKFLPGESAANVRDETRLLTSGILDSLASLELVSYIEHEFGVELTATDRSAENLDRIVDIARLVQLRRGKEGA